MMIILLLKLENGCWLLVVEGQKEVVWSMGVEGLERERLARRVARWRRVTGLGA
jgi:hypothetical protein